MQSIVDVIEQRVSTRSYNNEPVEEKKRKQLIDFLGSNTKGPFGNDIRFELLDLMDIDRSEIKSLGTYGVIKNASLLIIGAVKNQEKAMEDYGYCMEKNILKATELGLGTC